MSNGLQRLTQSMKTSNPQDSNSHVFISEELQGRIDTSQLIKEESTESLETVDQNPSIESAECPDQAAFTFSDLAFPCFYRLSAWQSDTVTIVVPPSHLERFFDLHHRPAEMTLFGEEFFCVDSRARKKDGEWFVTITLRS